MRLTASCVAPGVVLMLVLAAAPARALDPMTFVSTSGSDNNACTRAAPCASIQRATQQVMAGGQVSCLDTGPISGGTISKSVTVDCASGSTLDVFRNGGAQFGAIGLTISGSAGNVVKIRNLRINGEGFNSANPGGPIGIDVLAGTLFIEHCDIENFIGASPAHGIKVEPGSGSSVTLFVADSVIRRNGLDNSGGGIIIQPSGTGAARVLIEHSRVENNTYGIFANGMGSTGVIAVQIRDTEVSGNVFDGVSSFTTAGQATASVTVDRSSSVLNGGNGVLAQGAPGYAILARSTVISNGVGLTSTAGGHILSYQNNQLSGNAADGAPTAVLSVK